MNLARDLQPVPWHGDRPLWDALAIGLPALALVALALLMFGG